MISDIVTGVRQLIQDLIAPDLKSIAAKQEALITRIDGLERNLILHLEALAKNMDAFRAEMLLNY